MAADAESVRMLQFCLRNYIDLNPELNALPLGEKLELTGKTAKEFMNQVCHRGPMKVQGDMYMEPNELIQPQGNAGAEKANAPEDVKCLWERSGQDPGGVITKCFYSVISSCFARPRWRDSSFPHFFKDRVGHWSHPHCLACSRCQCILCSSVALVGILCSSCHSLFILNSPLLLIVGPGCRRKRMDYCVSCRRQANQYRPDYFFPGSTGFLRNCYMDGHAVH